MTKILISERMAAEMAALGYAVFDEMDENGFVSSYAYARQVENFLATFT